LAIKLGVVNVRVDVLDAVAAEDITKVVSYTLTTVVPDGIPVPETTCPTTTAALLDANVAVMYPLVIVIDWVNEYPELFCPACITPPTTLVPRV